MKAWQQELLTLLGGLIENWSAAFEGTPETQMEALNFLSDMREQVMQYNSAEAETYDQ